MSFFALCITAVCGLVAGVGLDQAIHRLPLRLFPELKAEHVVASCAPGNRSRLARRVSTVVAAILGAAIFTWSTNQFGFTARGAIVATWLGGLVVLAGIDLRHYLLPDLLTFGLLGLGLGASAAGLGFVGWQEALCGAILGYVVLRGLNTLYRRIRGVDGFGGGDLKMMAALGGWMGTAGVVDVLTCASLLALAFAAAATVVGARRITAQTALPFGPFLAISAAALAVAGN